MNDAVMVEVLRNQFMGVVRELGHVIRNAAHTVFVKETSDFGAYLVSPAGEVFMTPDDMGIFITIGTPMDDAIAAIDHYDEGDVCVTNDPEGSGGMVTHLPDFFMWTPIFAPGADKPLCFAACFIHATDIGGLVPGSVSPLARDMFQEGFILPPSKLVRRGERNEELAAIMAANSRVPELNQGDFDAEVAALAVSRTRMGELIARYGADTVGAGIEGVLAYSERQARGVIEQIPDGTYHFSDYLEADFEEPMPPIRIALDLVVKGSEMVLDFSGTDPQVPFALNLATQGKPGHNMVVPGLVNYFRSQVPDITYNSGMIRPVGMIAPRGSLLNPEPRAPVGARQATMFRVPEVILGALAQAVPDRVPACGGGQGAIMLMAAPEFESGTNRVSILQPLIGGSGGGPYGDGNDGVDYVAGFYRNIPTEVLESDAPVLVERYELRQDGGGPGASRGGLGLDFWIRALSPQATVTCRGMERMHFRPWGRDGGHPGTQSRARLRRPDGSYQVLGKIDVLELHPGEVLEMTTPCGAGYGDPLERPVDLVVADAGDGFVSLSSTEEHYGVVICDGVLDGAATVALRDKLAAARPAGGFSTFGFGPERDEHDALWTREICDAVNSAVWAYPSGLRGIVRSKVIEELTPQLARGDGVDPASIAALTEGIVSGMRQLLYR